METPEPRDAPGATSIDSDIAADAVSNAPLPDTPPDAPPNTGAARGIADPRARSVPSVDDLRPLSPNFVKPSALAASNPKRECRALECAKSRWTMRCSDPEVVL